VPLVLALPLALFAAGGERYRMAENVLVNPLIRWLAPGPRPQHDARPEDFDQDPKSAPARSLGRRRLLSDVQPFQNVILVFYESVRWLDLQLDRPDTACPNLARLAREGLFSRSYVPVPHSSKAYYSVLTGRYPYPGIEMRETLAFSSPSFVRSILEHAPGTRSLALTSMHLAFENTDGLLQSLGLEERLDLEALSRRYGAVVEQRSSFGGDDAVLYDLATRYLAERPGPFVAVLQPLGAHYPYEYPGKPPTQGSDYAAYRAALAYSDTLLGKLVELLGQRGLLQDTLLVVVGDHGEAFGEHGVYAHNSSLYFEETAVPLLFWSSDQRLRHPELILSRQIDIGPTILDLFAIEDDTQPVQGRSLLRSDGLLPMYMSTFFDDLALGLVAPPYKFIYEPATDQLQRYDLFEDVLDRHPAPVTGPEHERVVRALRAFQAAQRASFDE
jgi:phosphoglycerol transferase MdoB-like AlkP superfamily enzyme